MYKYVCFVRGEGKNQLDGEIAGYPLDKFPLYSEPFYVCKVDSSIINSDILSDDKIRLKLPALRSRYPNSTKQVEDENGDFNTVDVFGYFDIRGRSNKEDCPIITLSDVLRG